MGSSNAVAGPVLRTRAVALSVGDTTPFESLVRVALPCLETPIMRAQSR